jgi:hypothetical protein
MGTKDALEAAGCTNYRWAMGDQYIAEDRDPEADRRRDRAIKHARMGGRSNYLDSRPRSRPRLERYDPDRYYGGNSETAPETTSVITQLGGKKRSSKKKQ